MADVSSIASSGDNIESLVNDVPGLSEEEKSQLMSVMLKAKELDVQEENKMRLPLEGQLSKYTNVMRGWQYRWFVLNPETGYLEYYMVVEGYKKPRGAVHLAGAVISPSDEDSQSFTLSAVCGEVYKLRASNAKERQFWVNRLRAVAEYHTQHIAKKNPPLNNRDQRLPSDSSNNCKGGQDQKALTTWYNNSQPVSTACTTPTSPVINSLASVADALSSVKDGLQLAGKRHQILTKVIEELPTCGHAAKCLDTDMLLLKATAHATMQCLEQCYSILQHQQLAANFPSGLPAGATVEWVEPQRTPPVNRRPLEAYPKSPLVHLTTAS